MRISSTKNGFHLQKNKIHLLNNNPISSPKKQCFSPRHIDQQSQHVFVNNVPYSRNEQGLLLKNGLRRQTLGRSPEEMGRNEVEYRQEGYGVRRGFNNLNRISPKTNQLQQNHNHFIPFQNQYQTIPTSNRNPQQIPLSQNQFNTFNHLSPHAIYTVYSPSQNLYTNQQFISQVQSRYESQRNSHNKDQLTVNSSIEKSTGSNPKINSQIGKNPETSQKLYKFNGKTILSKTKVLSNSKKPSSKMNKRQSNPFSSNYSSNPNFNANSNQQPSNPFGSSKDINTQAINQMNHKKSSRGSRLRFKNSQQIRQNHKINGQFSPDAQYFGNQMNTVVSSGVSPRGVSPRSQHKKKVNFLRLSKSLEEASIKSKIYLQPTKISNKISFDKMYDQEDFESKHQFKEQYVSYQNQKKSIANSQNQTQKLTEMVSELKQKKEYRDPHYSHENPNSIPIKTCFNSEVTKNRNEYEEEKTRIKIPSFHNYSNPHPLISGTLAINRGFLNTPHQNTINDQYMIETRNISFNTKNQDHLNFRPKPVLNPVMKTSQFLKPSVMSKSVQSKSKVVSNSQDIETKNALKVVNFSPKYNYHPIQMSKSQERPMTFNETAHNPFQKNIIINQRPISNAILRPHSSISQFSPSHPQIQIRIENNGYKIANQNHEFVSIDRGSSFSPEQNHRRPYSQSARPLSKLQSSKLVQNFSSNSNLLPQVSQNINNHILQVNSTIKVQSLDNHLQNLKNQNVSNGKAFAQNEVQTMDKIQNKRLSRGNEFYHLKGKNSNVMPSVVQSQGLSSIIMGMKSYKQNNSYFIEGKNEQNQSHLAYNEDKEHGLNTIMNNGSKPSSASSKGKFGTVENTLPIDSKPNSPQQYIYGNGFSSMENNMENNFKVQKSIETQLLQTNSNQSNINNGRKINQEQSKKLLSQKNVKQSLIMQNAEKNISSQLPKCFMNNPSIIPRHIDNQQGLYSQQFHEIEQRSIVFNSQHNHANFDYIQVNPSKLAHHKQLINKSKQKMPMINFSTDHQQNDQSWLNINRQKYSTSEYLKIQQINNKLQYAAPPKIQSNQIVFHTRVYGQNKIYGRQNGYNEGIQLQTIRQTEKEYITETNKNIKQSHQKIKAVVSNLQPCQEDHFYHAKNQCNTNGQVGVQQNKSQSSSQRHENEMVRIGRIEKQELELRNKINSISQTVLSMSPIHLPEHHNGYQIKLASWNQKNTENSQENQVDRTKEYSSIQPIEIHPNSYLSDVQYEYSEEQSYNHQHFDNHIHSKPSSRLSANKDLSDTKKITHIYKSTAKKSHNKMKQKKSQLNPSTSNLHNHLQHINPIQQSSKVNKISNFAINNHQIYEQNQYRNQNKHSDKVASHEARKNELLNSAQKDRATRNYNKMGDSLRKQTDSEGRVFYTPIQSSQIIELSSLNSLSFNFVATNYQPSKNSFKQGSLLTLSKANLQSSKQLDGNEKLAKSNKLSQKIITEPIMEEESLYTPIPYVKQKNITDLSFEASKQENTYSLNGSETPKNKFKLSNFTQKLKESQYGISEDSVNYIPIERINKNQEFSTSNKRHFIKGFSNNGGLKDSISEVQYYESRYEYTPEGLVNKRSVKEDEQKYFKFDTQFLNSVEGEGSFSNVIQTINLNHNENTDEEGQFQ